MSRIEITNRDLELLKKLSTHGMLTSKQVRELFFPDVALTTVLRRLRLLESNYFIKKLLGLESQENLWILERKGATAANVPLPKRRWSKNLLEHDFKLLCVRLKLESASIAQSWIPEHIIRAAIFEKHWLREAKEMLVPDGLMAYEHEGAKYSMAIEVELTQKNRSRYIKIFRRYAENSDIVGVWYLVSSKGQMNQLRRIWNELGRKFRIFFSLISSVLETPHGVSRLVLRNDVLELVPSIRDESLNLNKVS